MKIRFSSKIVHEIEGFGEEDTIVFSQEIDQKCIEHVVIDLKIYDDPNVIYTYPLSIDLVKKYLLMSNITVDIDEKLDYYIQAIKK